MVKYPMVLKEGGEEGTAERCPMQRKMHRPWDSQSYISLLCYFQAMWPWEITFQGYHRTEVAYTNCLSHTLACSRCSVDSSDYTPGLWSDRVYPYLWFPFTLLSVLSTESLDHFFQEADIDFFSWAETVFLHLCQSCQHVCHRTVDRRCKCIS